jgi:hypothetical protein
MMERRRGWVGRSRVGRGRKMARGRGSRGRDRGCWTQKKVRGGEGEEVLVG